MMMRTLQASRASGLRRDVALLWRIASMVFQYFVAGGRLRRAYRRMQARGETLWLDATGPTRHREDTLRGR